MTDPLGRSSDGLLNPRITDSPLPAMNDTCPECNTGIVDGSAWRTDPEAAITTRVHTHCLNRRDRALREDVLATTPTVEPTPTPNVEPIPDSEEPVLSGLGAARACIAEAARNTNDHATLALVGAINELIQYLQQKETP